MMLERTTFWQIFLSERFHSGARLGALGEIMNCPESQSPMTEVPATVAVFSPTPLLTVTIPMVSQSCIFMRAVKAFE